MGREMNNHCDRCGQSIEKVFTINGIEGNYGSTCVYIVARENGIKYKKNHYGPGVFDSATIRRALNIFSKSRYGLRWEEKQILQKEYVEIKSLLGSVGWRIVWGIANDRPIRTSDNPVFWKLYNLTVKIKRGSYDNI
jgi:hypothetical protein